MADRNTWDPPTPTGHIEKFQQGRVVELFIYRFPQSAKDHAQIRADVEVASQIWCQTKVNLQVVYLEALPVLPVSEPLDLHAPDLSRRFTCGDPGTSDQFFAIPRPQNPNIRTSLAVFYIPGDTFTNGGKGCHQFRFQSVDDKPEHLIIMTDGSTGQVLAHELGHALLTRDKGSGQWINDDPDPMRDPSVTGHNLDPQNLMFPVVDKNPVITPPQASVAGQSPLVHQENLVFGFKEAKPFKVGVDFKSMTVTTSSDEWSSDDALESTWEFKVSVLDSSKNVISTESKSWTKDPLHWWTYDLNELKGTNPPPGSVTFPSIKIPSKADDLEISVTGTDWDFWSPNDELPGISHSEKSSDKWGTGKGDQSKSASNNEISYSVLFNTTLEDEPKETKFRSIC